MHQRDRRRYEMLVRVRTFAVAHAHLFPPDSPAHDAIAAVSAEIQRLEELTVEARSASQAARAERMVAARRALTDILLRGVHTAAVIKREGTDLRADIKLPLPKDDLSSLTVARYFVQQVTPAATRLAAHGIPLDELQAGVAAFEKAVNDHSNGRVGRVGARIHTRGTFDRAMHAVATLDVSVANYCASDPVAQASWQHARRLGYRHRKPRREKKTTAIAAPQPVGVVPTASRLSAAFEFLLSKFRAKRQLPPPDVEVDVIEPPRQPTRLLGP